MRFFTILLLLLFINRSAITIDTKATQAIVYFYNTKEVIFEKEADKLTYPASLTKIMTVYVAFARIKNTNLSIQDQCIISPKAYKKHKNKFLCKSNDNCN